MGIFFLHFFSEEIFPIFFRSNSVVSALYIINYLYNQKQIIANRDKLVYTFIHYWKQNVEEIRLDTIIT